MCLGKQSFIKLYMNSIVFDMLEPETDQQISTFLMLQGNSALSFVLNVIYISKVKMLWPFAELGHLYIIFPSPDSIVLYDVLLLLLPPVTM